ncbi:MAG: 2-phosphosulfolactate phosphatase [Bacteroidales bacterium]
MSKLKFEVCLSPALFQYHKRVEAIAVIVDTLRATSSICEAFTNGASAVIPVATVEEAREYKKRGYSVAAERDGIILDFADFGNSPFNFSRENVAGKEIVYSTTNGTRTIGEASGCAAVVIGSFLNISALTGFLAGSDRDIIILCAGWKNRVNLEDSFFAGALSRRLLDTGIFETECDSAKIALDLWSAGSSDMLAYIEKAAQRKRLGAKGLDDCIPYCHTPDSTTVIPILNGDRLVSLAD